MPQRGAGAPPSRRGGNQSSANRPIYYLAEPVVRSSGQEFKIVKALKLRPGDKRHPVLTLDDYQKTVDGYSINIHVFNLRGTRDNMVVCSKTENDPRPCPVCDVLNRDPSWYVCLTAIDRFPYTFDKQRNGKTEKVVYTDLRRLVLITNAWTQRMSMFAEKPGTWRGALWEVSRSTPVQETRGGQSRTSFRDSPRIGDVWDFSKKLTEDQMKAELDKAAAAYGLPLEKFIQPFNYEKLLAPKSHQQLSQIANDIRQDGSAVKSYGGASDSDDAEADADADTSAEAEAEIRY